MIEIRITGETPDQLTAQVVDLPFVADVMEEWARAYLRKRNVRFDPYGDPETVAEYLARTGCSKMTFHRRTHDPKFRHLYSAKRGPGGRRIIQIRSTPEFDRLCRPKTKEEACAA